MPRAMSAPTPTWRIMDKMISEMTDAAAKKSATMHLDMSKAEMKKGNEAGCMEHMAEAHKAMGM